MDIRKILEKIKKTETPKVNKVAVAYSGGLDSSLAIELLRRKYDGLVKSQHHPSTGSG